MLSKSSKNPFSLHFLKDGYFGLFTFFYKFITDFRMIISKFNLLNIQQFCIDNSNFNWPIVCLFIIYIFGANLIQVQIATFLLRFNL